MLDLFLRRLGTTIAHPIATARAIMPEEFPLVAVSLCPEGRYLVISLTETMVKPVDKKWPGLHAQFQLWALDEDIARWLAYPLDPTRGYRQDRMVAHAAQGQDAVNLSTRMLMRPQFAEEIQREVFAALSALRANAAYKRQKEYWQEHAMAEERLQQARIRLNTIMMH